MKILFTKKAAQDLEDIWVYSYEKWGFDHAEGYVHQLKEKITNLLNFPEIGTPRNDILFNIRSIYSGEHNVFYEVSSSDIIILRIKHMSSEPLF